MDTGLIGGGGYGHGPAMSQTEAQAAQDYFDGYLAARRGTEIDWNAAPMATLHGWNAARAGRTTTRTA